VHAVAYTARSVSIFLLIRPPPTSPLFPYTTLFRSAGGRADRRAPRPRRPDGSGRSREARRPHRQGVRRDRRARQQRRRSAQRARSEEHTSELQSPCNLVCRLLLEKKKENRHT